MKKKLKDIVAWAMIFLSAIILIITMISPILFWLSYNEPWYLFLYFVIFPVSILEGWMALIILSTFYSSYYRYKK